MNTKIKSISIFLFLLCTISIFTSCKKENIDETTIDNFECSDFNVSISEDDGILVLNISGGTAPFDIIWSGEGLSNETDTIIEVSKTGDYLVEVLDANDCRTRDLFFYEVP